MGFTVAGAADVAMPPTHVASFVETGAHSRPRVKPCADMGLAAGMARQPQLEESSGSPCADGDTPAFDDLMARDFASVNLAWSFPATAAAECGLAPCSAQTLPQVELVEEELRGEPCADFGMISLADMTNDDAADNVLATLGQLPDLGNRACSSSDAFCGSIAGSGNACGSSSDGVREELEEWMLNATDFDFGQREVNPPLPKRSNAGAHLTFDSTWESPCTKRMRMH